MDFTGGPEISRRGFLLGVASLPVAKEALAAGSPEPADGETELVFDLSPDEKVVRVVRVRHFSPDERERLEEIGQKPELLERQWRAWEIRVTAFGPNAILDLEPTAKLHGDLDASHALAIRNVSYGELTGATVIFRFYKYKQADEFQWRVGMITDVWQSKNGGGKQYHIGAKDGVPLSAMAAEGDKARLVMTLTPARVNKTFGLVADGLIRCDSGTPSVAIDGALGWHVKGHLSAFAGKAHLDELSFGWEPPSAVGSNQATDNETLFRATATVTALDPIAIGSSSDLPLIVHAADPTEKEIRKFWLVGQTHSVASFATGDFSKTGPKVGAVAWIEPIAGTLLGADRSRIESVGSFERLPFHNGTLSQTVALAAPGTPLRTAIWGNVWAPGETEVMDLEEDRETPGPEVLTRIGRIRCSTQSPVEDAVAEIPAGPADGSTRARIGRIISAALGDRSGIAESTLYALGDGRAPSLRRFSADVYVVAMDTALSDVQDSDLEFDPTSLRLAYADDQPLTTEIGIPFYEHPLAEPPGFVWLGPVEVGGVVARIDLLRAALRARADRDLVDLTFRFADMHLEFKNTGSGTNKMIRPRTEDCVARSTADGVLDNRPVLSVEFAPQHVMEEAFFRLEPPPLPDAPTFLEQAQAPHNKPPETMESVSAILGKLQTLASEDERRSFRQEVSDRKIAIEAQAIAGNQSDLSFTKFGELFKKAAKDLPADHQIYIGPYGLDPDGMAIARNEQAKVLLNALADVPSTVEAEAAQRLLNRYRDQSGKAPLPPDVTEALRREREIEAELPLYRLWRDSWRDHVVSLTSGSDPLEWLMESNRPQPISFNDGTKKDARSLMIARLSGNEPIADLAMARLSGPSFVAFRMNCVPSAQDGHEIDHLPEKSPATPRSPRGLGTSFGEMPFTFAALTDWSHHEPAVSRRAQRLYSPTLSGELPPVADSAADLDPHKMLAFQGISTRAQQTTAQRMREIQAVMDEVPAQFETHIELPSRVILSTGQDAVWRTKRQQRPFPATLGPSSSVSAGPSGADLTSRQLTESAEPLWSARLVTTDGLRALQPGVRVIDSPDFRVGALSRSEFPTPNGSERAPGEAAPPRGKYAPWMLGRDEWDGGGQAELCKPQDQGASPRSGLIRWICEQFDIRAKMPADVRFFRSSLDAYDRHELVLLSSGYGLPVLPAGNAAGGSQFIPSSEFLLIDGTNEQAVYVPKALELKELTLTALGGSLDHDTIFVPPAPARHSVTGKAMFDGLSIERWQHRTVLGRDIVATVVYSGYLFPFGHRASLVKVTERIFHRTPKEGIKAPLRQRMFIRISDPDKNYPAVGQPNEGRRWCARKVKLITKTTSDIVDPLMSTTGKSSITTAGQVDLNGRISLTGSAGLAFWPKTSLSESGLVSFDLEVDGRVTSMPLIFIDKTAVQDTASLTTVVNHYNSFSRNEVEIGSEDPRCKMRMGGQTLDFAPSKVSGDTSFATDTIVLRAEGRYKGDGDRSWAQDNVDYDNIAALESAAQPPFYPVVGAAHIRIEQVETLTGETGRSVRVKYDGHYVRHGFANERSEGGSPAVKNPAEVFLCVADYPEPPRLGMGAKGDQAGALAQPNMTIAALGRKTGPLGASTPAYSMKPGEAEKTAVIWTSTQDPRAAAAEMFSLAEHFAMGTNTLQPAATSAANEAGANAAFKDFFATDAKLLGVVKLSDLIEFLDVTGATDSLPILKEAMEFGPEALARLQDGAHEAIDLVRQEILVPFRELGRRIREQWRELDKRLIEKQRGLGFQQGQGEAGEPLSIKTIYPEMDAGLAALEQALDRAVASDDPATTLTRLAAVHESGKQFARQLAAIASNPIERVEAELQRRVTTFTVDVNNLVKSVGSLFEGWGKSLATALVTEVSTLINEWLQQGVDGLVAITGLPFPLEIIDSAADAISDASVATLLVDEVRPILTDLDVAPIRQTVDEQLQLVGDGKATGEQSVVAVLTVIYELADAKREDAKKKINESALSTDGKGVALAWIEAYGAELVRLKAHITANAERKLGEYSEGIEQLLAAKRRVARLLETVRLARGTSSEEELRRLILSIAMDWIGVDLTDLAQFVAGKLAKALRPYISGAPTRIEAFFGTAPTALPDGAAAYCLTENQLQESAKAIASANGDPMKAFAAIVVTLPDAKAKLAEIRNVVVADGAVNLAKPEILKSCGNLDKALEAFQLMFRDCVLLRYSAERAGTRLQTALKAVEDAFATDPANLQKLEEVVNGFGEEFRQFVAREREVLASLVGSIRVLMEELARASGVIGIAALGAALADALKNSDVQSKADEFKTFANANQKELAKWLFRTAQWVSSTAASIADPATALTSELSTLAGELNDRSYLSLLDPERSELSAKITALATKINGVATGVGDLNKAIGTLNETASLEQLLQALRSTVGTNNLDKQLLGIRNAADEVAISGAAFIARSRGLPGIIRARADTLLSQATKYASPKLKAKLNQQAAGLGTRQTELLAKGDAWGTELVKTIFVIHDKLTTARDDAYAQFDSKVAAFLKIKEAIVVKPVDANATPQPYDELRRENSLLEAVKNSGKPLSDDAVRKQVRDFVQRYATDRAALQVMSRQIREASKNLERGDVLSLIDVGSLREEVEERISELVPLKRTLNYRLDFAFKATPDNPIAKIFQPQQGGRFTLEMAATIDLVKLDTKMTAKGRIDSFDIKLVGGFVDALTLSFEGAEFSFGAGGSPKFDVFYRDFTIGRDLDFVQKLQGWLKPNKDGSGFFIQPARGVPGIKAGYGISLPIITLGNVSFSNVSLNTGVILPFDGGEALFEVSLGRPMALFRIAASPYAGGGFLAVTANVDGVKGFEMSLAFGGGGAFQAGPLVGQGFIDTGIYVRTLRLSNGKRITDLYGTFYAGGSASIWVFNFAASLYVRLGMSGGGDMEGEAIFTFSFSMGIVDYDYRCEMRQRRGKLESGSTGSISGTGGRRGGGIAIEHEPQDGVDPIITHSNLPDIETITRVKRRTKGLAQDIDTFLSYFDLDIVKKVSL